MKNLFDWIVEQTPQYKHILTVCKQEIKECEEIKRNYNKLLESNRNEREFTKELKQDITNKLKQLRKIRTHVNKLDKKDENVKAIKQLIKEVL